MRETFNEAMYGARERLVVIGQSQVGLKLTAVVLLVAFLAGFVLSWYLDFTGYQKFRQRAAALAQEQRQRNLTLLHELDRLRRELREEESDRVERDRRFEFMVNKPGEPGECRVPAEKLNPIISEASK